jgi:hypothetical protein
MKKIAAILSLGLMLMSFTIQTDTNDIINALKTGNANQFSKYFDNILDVKLPEKDEIKSIGKTQASVTMKSFFDENNIKGFDASSQRELGGIMYIAGKLQGSSKAYQLTLMLKENGNDVVITNIRIN